MEINKVILEAFKEANIRQDDGICYLLSLYYGFNPTYIPDDFKMRMNTLRIYEYNKDVLRWNVPLFDGQELAFGWVEKDYVSMFKDANSSKGGKVRESIVRMKKLFAHHPDIRKEEVLNATRMYIMNTDPNYLRFPHYFIEKGVGVDKTYDLLDWIEKYRLSQMEGSGRVASSNTMQ